MYTQINAAAEDLKVTRQWVHKLINSGGLNTGLVAGRRFVLLDDKYKIARVEIVKMKEARRIRAIQTAEKALLPKRPRGRPRKVPAV